MRKWVQVLENLQRPEDVLRRLRQVANGMTTLLQGHERSSFFFALICLFQGVPCCVTDRVIPHAHIPARMCWKLNDSKARCLRYQQCSVLLPKACNGQIAPGRT